MSERTVVAIGCSTDKDYAFLAPLTARMWREVVGFDPIVFLVNKNDWQSGYAEVVLDSLGEFARPIPKIDGYSIGTIAQNVRQHASAIAEIAADDWIMTSDVDLWPLRRDFYRQHESSGKRAVLFYANGDHFQGKKITLEKFEAAQPFQSIPTCHVAMRAKDWREVYQIKALSCDLALIAYSTSRTLERMEPWLSRHQDQGFARWCCDQWYMTERLCRQEWFPDFPIPYPTPPGGRILSSDHVMMIERYGHPPVDRLDRGAPPAWEQPFDKERYTDAHLLKSPWEEAQWCGILRVIDAMIPQHSSWAREYRDRFVGALR